MYRFLKMFFMGLLSLIIGCKAWFNKISEKKNLSFANILTGAMPKPD
jgi:hypothetical protein